MSREQLSGEEPTQEIIDYAWRLRQLAIEEGVPENAVSDRGFALAAELLEKAYHDHGDPTQDTYKHRHNDSHALDFIRNFWALWKPLSEHFPDLFDQDGFELGMIVGAGHDIVFNQQDARERPGHNERASAQLVSSMMSRSGYDYGPVAIERAYNGIIKTTVERKNGVIVQTHMREGSTDLLGLCAGQADMNGPLIKGPSKLIRTAYTVWLEEYQYEHPNEALVKDVLKRPPSFASFLINQKHYFGSRVVVLSEDLKHYVSDNTTRAEIIAVYREYFGSASLRTLEVVDTLHGTPETTKKLVNESFNAAEQIAHQGLGRLMMVPRYLADRLRLNGDDDDPESGSN